MPSRGIIVAVIALLAVLDGAQAASMPPDVLRYADRREGCNHWAGEEGYDAARRAEINKAIADLRCTALNRDERVLRHRYRHNPAVLRHIRKARDTYPG
jgi:nitric oxide reductase activation protein